MENLFGVVYKSLVTSPIISKSLGNMIKAAKKTIKKNKDFKYAAKYYYKKHLRDITTISGINNIPKANGYIMVTLHSHMVESMIWQYLLKSTIHWVMAKKHDLLSKKILEKIKVKTIEYDRSIENIKESGKNVKKQIAELCKEGKNIGVFIGEGYDKNFIPSFKKGLFYLAYTENIPILPTQLFIGKTKYNSNICLNIPENMKITGKIYELVYPHNYKTFDDFYDYIYNILKYDFLNFVNEPTVAIHEFITGQDIKKNMGPLGIIFP